MFHKFDICGWYDGPSEAATERCTEIAPENVPEERVHGQVYPNFTGYVWIELAYPGTTVSAEV